MTASTTRARPRRARYRDIEAYLRGLIERASPGDPLPSEAELCARFAVSRMTVRQALTELTSAGLVDRQRGRGTFVAAAPVHRRPGVFLSFTEEMSRRGVVASSRVVSAGLEPGRPPELSDLRLPPGSDVLRLVRVRLADGVPVALEDAAVLPSLADGLAGDPLDGSLHAALARSGTLAARADGTITARLAPQVDAALLDLERPAALLVELRLLYDRAGRPFERTETRYVAERYVIDVVHTSP